MAEPLRNQYGPEVPRKIAAMIAGAWPGFPARAFLRRALDGYGELDLMARARHVAGALAKALPTDFPRAADILVASLGPPLEHSEGNGMAPFLYLPHAFFVAENGLEHFEPSLRAQYEITQRFTAEFSIRPFLDRYPGEMLARLEVWARDPSKHVRRLVSEGTRPRLPWAPRLRTFGRDPRTVLPLLELLRDDPEIYVRRSVANHLNDIGKDHPQLLVEVARHWMKGAGEERRRLVRHALRSAVKRGDRHALGILGFGGEPKVSITRAALSPKRVRLGGEVEIAFELTSTHDAAQRVLVDFRVFFVKAGGASAPKVFKLRSVELAPRQALRLSKTLSLAEMTTRKHYRGVHRVEAIVNGRTHPLGEFQVI